MSARQRVAESWEHVIQDFLAGGSVEALPDPFAAWFRSYRGTGEGAVQLEAMPEPYGGSLRSGVPAAIFLDLNPGRADLEFQGRTGIFAQRIKELGSYDAFAARRPYLNEPWTDAHGPNFHAQRRLAFMRRWHGEEAMAADRLMSFELYPWHSPKVTAPIRPDPRTIREFIWEPIAELDNPPVFAFGSPWFDLLEHHAGLSVVDRLGRGGRDYGSSVKSRSVLVLRAPGGGLVLAEKHSGSAIPPKASEVELLRTAVQRLV